MLVVGDIVGGNLRFVVDGYFVGYNLILFFYIYLELF